MAAPLYTPQEAYSANPGAVERNVGALNGANYITLVPAPGEGRMRQVIAVTVPNNTAGALTLSLVHNDGIAPTRTVIDYRGGATVVAVGDTYSSSQRLPIIVLRDFDILEAILGGAGTPPFYVCWTEGPASVLGSQT